MNETIKRGDAAGTVQKMMRLDNTQWNDLKIFTHAVHNDMLGDTNNKWTALKLSFQALPNREIEYAIEQLTAKSSHLFGPDVSAITIRTGLKHQLCTVRRLWQIRIKKHESRKEAEELQESNNTQLADTRSSATPEEGSFRAMLPLPFTKLA